MSTLPHEPAPVVPAVPADPSAEAGYPPAPWRLRGDMFGAVLRLPPGTVPQRLLPAHKRIERRDGSVIAVVAWVDYRAGGVLEYRELMVTAMTRITLPLTGTILRIWVDSRQSLEGGRQLWRIPKDLADFTVGVDGGFQGSVSVDGEVAASYRFVPRHTVPLKIPSRMVLQQDADSGLRRTVSSMRGRMQTGRGELTIPDGGELAFLNAGKPLAHLAVRDFTAVFGIRSKDI